MHQEMQRGLGFWAALTIGVGTMVGAGIFLLAGTAVDLAGPAAIYAYLLAAGVCVITAASAAELATGMPTSGGAYYFVSRSMGAAVGAVCGVGMWLSLTVAIAFYLVGMGAFLGQVVPVTPVVGGLIGGVVLTGINVLGARQSGGTQVTVVVALLAILGVFVAGGAFGIEADNLRPFAPFGWAPVLPTAALIFVSFLGFVQIATVAEEISDPDRNLPRTLIGSVVLVGVLYVLIVIVIAGIFSQRTIGQVADPLTSAARATFGPLGAQGIILGGFLATLSSANASILATSRVSLAMARDGLFPKPLAAIHPRFLTPHRSLLLTGGLALGCLLALPNLEQLARVASSLQLLTYAALNVGCVLLRAADPAWYRPAFRTPGFPLAQLFATAGCLAIIGYSGLLAQLALAAVIAVTLAWFLVAGRHRVAIVDALADLRSRWAQLGPRVLVGPAAAGSSAPAEPGGAPAPRAVGPAPPRFVVAALANPATEADLLRVARAVATGADEGGKVVGVHLVPVPFQTPLEAARQQFAERPSVERSIAELAATDGGRVGGRDGGVPLERTEVQAHVDVAHDVFGALVDEVRELDADLLLLGWRGGFSLGRIHSTPIRRVMTDAPADLAVLKPRGSRHARRIVVPWGGGTHARLGLELAVRIARAHCGRVDVLRVVRPGVEAGAEEASLRRVVAQVVGDDAPVTLRVATDASVSDGLFAFLDAHEPDLVIIGASGEARIRTVLFGSIPDLVAEQAPCSVLMVRRYVPEHWSERVGTGLKRTRDALGWTSSPEDG